MSGRHIAADEALAMGLADKVVPADALVATAMADAAKWAEGPTLGYAAVKNAMNGGWGKPILDALGVERRIFNEVFRTQDAKRGITAFLEKDSAKFEGN